MSVTALSPEHRAWSLQRMRDEVFDVAVIGGGITGSGAALDAASRGLSVALIEARDYAAGASSKSSKLIHGGLRYLEMLHFGLVKEALSERNLLLTKLAPHLVRPVPFLWPLTHRLWERAYVGAGLILYDTMGGAKVLPGTRHLTRRGALRIAPALRPDALVGAIQFYDAQEDDARMVVCVARTAAGLGAALATNVRADGLIKESGRVVGVRAYDVLHSALVTIHARHVVSATGAWTDDIQAMGQPSAGSAHIRPSKGIHILVPRSSINMNTGLLARTEKSVLFVIPWGDYWLIGDTDTEWDYDKGYPSATLTDVDYLLAKTNAILAQPLGHSDIVGVFAGLRPLVASAANTDADTNKLSREHVIVTPVPGLSTIAGGKYTTYRLMARDVIDVAVKDLPAGVPASRTACIPLHGAEGYTRLVERVDDLAKEWALPRAQVDRLLGRYGAAAVDLVTLIAGRPELREALPGCTDDGYIAAEVVYACTNEGAVRLADVLERRTRLAIQSRDHALVAAPRVAALMALELGWDEQRLSAELDNYEKSVAAEEAARAQITDSAANELRLRVTDVASFYKAKRDSDSP